MYQQVQQVKQVIADGYKFFGVNSENEKKHYAPDDSITKITISRKI